MEFGQDLRDPGEILRARIETFLTTDADFLAGQAAIDALGNNPEAAKIRALNLQVRDSLRSLAINPASFNLVRGGIVNLPRNFPPRRALCRFLDGFARDEKLRAHLAPARNRLAANHRGPKGVDNSLTPTQRGTKNAALGLCDRGRYAEAADLIRPMLQRDRQLYRNPTILGILMNSCNRIGTDKAREEALSVAELLIELEPDNITALGTAVTCAYYLRKYEIVLVYVEPLLRYSEHSGTCNMAALSAKALENYESAYYYAEWAVELEPRNIGLLGNATHLAFHLKRHREAYEYGKRALAIDPGNSTILALMTRICSLLGSVKEARRYGRELDAVHASGKAYAGEAQWGPDGAEARS